MPTYVRHGKIGMPVSCSHHSYVNLHRSNEDSVSRTPSNESCKVDDDDDDVYPRTGRLMF